MRTPLLVILAASMTLAACGGSGTGGGSSSIPSGGGGGTGGNTPQSVSEQAIGGANSLGDPVKTMTDDNLSLTGVQLASRTANAVPKFATNTCVNGIEFFVPDKNGDKNSTESQFFYDGACTEMARDIVRVFQANGTSETVNQTETQYALNNATAIATRTSTITFANGTYDSNGFPIVANGFARSANGTLAVGPSKTIQFGDELVVAAGTGGVNSFCGDSAGFNQTGIAALNETFGWQGMTNGGTRTVNSDGSVTWQTTRSGSTSKGAIGSLSIATGTANTACPISTPQFTLAGGTSQGSYTLPVTTQFLHGELVSLTVSNATLANGNTLNVTTNSSLSPTNDQFITGTVTNGTTQIATFNVDTFGDGTLTVTSNGAQYVMDDWHVVK